MEAVLRATFIYFFLLATFRLSGKTTLSSVSPFHFVLLVIIGDVLQQPLLNGDHSLTHSIVLVMTLVFLSIVTAKIKVVSVWAEQLVEGTPIILVAHGKAFKKRLDKEHINEQKILESARKLHGIERMDQIKFAVLEKNGEMSIIPNNDD